MSLSPLQLTKRIPPNQVGWYTFRLQELVHFYIAIDKRGKPRVKGIANPGVHCWLSVFLLPEFVNSRRPIFEKYGLIDWLVPLSRRLSCSATVRQAPLEIVLLRLGEFLLADIFQCRIQSCPPKRTFRLNRVQQTVKKIYDIYCPARTGQTKQGPKPSTDLWACPPTPIPSTATQAWSTKSGTGLEVQKRPTDGTS